MRRIGWTDVHAAACVLCGLPVEARAEAVERMLTHVAAADAFRQRFGTAHPEWGNGSLFAMLRMAHDGFAEPDFSDPDYRQCLTEVLAALGGRHVAAFEAQVGIVGSGGRSLKCADKTAIRLARKADLTVSLPSQSRALGG